METLCVFYVFIFGREIQTDVDVYLIGSGKCAAAVTTI
jgi:hypothetical protein